MKEELVTFETAKLAKQKGFPQNIGSSWYNELGDLDGRTDLNKDGKTFSEAYPDEESFYGCAIKPEHKKEFKLKSFSAPTQSLLQKWLRQEHGIDVLVLKEKDEANNIYIYCWEVHISEKEYILTQAEPFDTYEQTLETGLQQALKLIEQ